MSELRQTTEDSGLRAAGLGRTLVERWRVGAAPPAGLPIPPRRGDDVPLSPAQRRLWFLEQFAPETSARVVHYCAWATGELDERAFRRSVDDLVCRHEVLRSTIRIAGGEPCLVFADDARVDVSVTDLRELPRRGRDHEAVRAATAVVREPFDLERGPLARVALFRTEPERHLLALVAHHLVCDGWSLGIVLRELAALYGAHAAGRAPALPAPAVRYGDVAVWQREREERDEWRDALDYWTSRLVELPALDLPTDRPRPPAQTSRGSRTRVHVTREVEDALRRLGRETGATLFMALLAAFHAFLARLSGQDDVPVGSPAANRGHPELQSVVGPFVNLLVLRGDVSGDPTFRELVRRTRELATEGYARQEAPLDRIVQELGPARAAGTAPFVQAAFTFQNAPLPEAAIGPLRLERVELEPEAVQYDLDVEVWQLPDGLEATLGHSSDLFDDATAARLAERLELLLADAARRPDARVSELELASPAERRLILHRWNDTAVELPDRCLHELFEEQAAKAPNATAVIDESGELTYAELNARANRLARNLRARGVGPESVVAVSMERAPELVVALLGILKAGGAYLPLDPDHPAERRAFILRDAGSPLVISHAPVAERLGEVPVPLLCLDDCDGLAAEAPQDPAPLARGANPAYVIHTSGSTGTPKGVVVSHAGIRNRVLWTVRTHGLGAADRVLQKTTLTFDAAAWEFLAPLVSGGAIVLARPGLQHDAERMLEAVVRHGVTVLQLVPSVFKLVVEEPALARCTSLHLVFCAGEPLPVRVCEQFFERLPGAELYNTYGPTECSIDVTAYRCRRGMRGPIAPIGRPIANTEVYVLDRGLRPAPIGVTGELYAGGVGLARGYLNRSAMTAERFVPDPFSGRAGARLYRTGDLARRLPDGNVEFVGRVDDQVKIRGFRIELGEIESALLDHPEIEEAVVLAREDEPGDRRLVAYVVCPESQPAPSELRAHLRRTLPDYMLPSAFVLPEALPLGRNGKVDRRALPPPDSSRPDLDQPYVASRTPLEELVSGVWADVLGLEKVGVRDNFFELGGHSLLATRVVNRLGESLAVDVPLRLMFERPTLADFAEALSDMRPERARAPVVTRLPRVPRRRPPRVEASDPAA